MTRSIYFSATTLALALATMSFTAFAQAPAPTPAVRPKAVVPMLAYRPASLADIVTASSLSVVQVSTTKLPGAGETDDDEANPIEELLRRYGLPGGKDKDKEKEKDKDKDKDKESRSGKNAPESAPRIPFPRPSGKRPSGGVGSGFFIDDTGYLLTNAHVVDGATKIVIRLSDKREMPARLIGLDKRTDIALLKAEPNEDRKFRPLPLGSTEQLRVGDWVLAIGSPFGLDFTATAGILSAKGRALPSEENNYIPFLQTDAAVNPGNSGGPLINERGQVIGINTQIYSRSGGYMGISFAIPIEYAVKVAGKIRKGNGKIEHGRIGATVQDLVPQLAEAFGVAGRSGAIILSVEPGSPAEKAGIQSGDVILSLDGKALVEGSTELIRLIADSDPGDRLVLGTLRKGGRLDIPVILGHGATTGNPSEDKPKAPEVETTPSSFNAEPLGLKGRPLTEREAKIEGVSRGVKVVEASGLSQQAGIEAEEVVLEVDHTSVGTLAELAAAVSKAPAGRHVALLVKRGEVIRYVAINPDMK